MISTKMGGVAPFTNQRELREHHYSIKNVRNINFTPRLHGKIIIRVIACVYTWLIIFYTRKLFVKVKVNSWSNVNKDIFIEEIASCSIYKRFFYTCCISPNIQNERLCRGIMPFSSSYCLVACLKKCCLIACSRIATVLHALSPQVAGTFQRSGRTRVAPWCFQSVASQLWAQTRIPEFWAIRLPHRAA
jgi:hypothetical protein